MLHVYKEQMPLDYAHNDMGLTYFLKDADLRKTFKWDTCVCLTYSFFLVKDSRRTAQTRPALMRRAAET